MSLHLDARQRAMLQEMGVTIWAPAQVSAAPAPVNDAEARRDICTLKDDIFGFGSCFA